jgi:hypothetical protein
MRDDIEGEIPVAPGVSELVCRRSSQRDATKDERAGVVGEFLFAVCAFLAHEADGIEFFDLALREDSGAAGGVVRLWARWSAT